MRVIGKKHKVPKLSFHHFYPKPYRYIDHNPRAGTYIERDFHQWIHMNYSNYELAHSFNNEDEINYIRELYETAR